MKKGLFFIYEDIENNTGVNKKIRGQLRAFKEKDIAIKTYHFQTSSHKKIYKFLYRLPFANLSPCWKYDDVFSKVDFIYLRRPFFCNVWFLIMLRKIKKNNPKIKILYEIPTYPYDAEIKKDKKNWILYLKDVICRKGLYKYIDRICILSDENKVFKVPTIRIKNGFDFSKIDVRNYWRGTDSINIALVALFDMWHGYERLIIGLKEYYNNGGKRDFTLHFIGDGPERKNYEELAKKFKISNRCIFYGMLNSQELSYVYDKCDLAAASFGLYKKKLYYSCELKSREYLGKGLPVICSGKNDLMEIDELNKYLLNFPNNKTIPDFKKIEMFYDKLYKEKSEEDIRYMMSILRVIGEKNFNMNSSMKNVIDFLVKE